MRARASYWLKTSTGLYSFLFLVYFLLAIGTTYPAFLGLFLPHTMPGGGDVIFFQYDYWWFKYAIFDLGVNPQIATLIYHPLGGLWIFGTLFNEIAAAFLQLVMSVSQAYTLLWLFTFPATALTTFALAHYVTRSKPAAFLAGLIFAFSTYRYAHGLGHAGLFTTQWLPLYVYALLRIRDRPTFRNGILLTGAVLLAGLSEFPYYLVYFIGLFLICFLAYGAWKRDCRVWNPRFVASVVVAFGFLGLVLVVAYSNILFAEAVGHLSRPGTFWLSADLLGFVLPSQWHPLWGELYAEPGSIGRYGLDLVEHSHYLGYVSLTLAVFGLGKFRSWEKRLWGLVTVVTFVLALGPALKVGGQVVLQSSKEGQRSLIPLPYWALMNMPFVSILRAPSRQVVLMQLAIAVASASGWAWIERALERFGAWRVVVVGLLSLVILFESLFMFPYAMTTISVSPLYDRLAQENLSGGILELPMALDRKPPEGRWYENVFRKMYEATIHHHPIVGGISNRPDPKVEVFNATTPYLRELLGADYLLRSSVEDPFHQDWEVLASVGPALLQRHNIDYVILHRDRLFEDEFAFLNDEIFRRLGEPFYSDESVVAYRVLADGPIQWPKTDRLEIIAGDGWYLPMWSGAQAVRRMSHVGEIVILSPESRLIRLTLTMNSQPGKANVVRVLVNGLPVETVFVPSEGMTLSTRSFRLNEGYNVVSLETMGDSKYAGDVANIVQFDVEVSRLEVVSAEAAVSVSRSFVARLGQDIDLIGADWEIGGAGAAQYVDVFLYWKAVASVGESYKVFVHLLGGTGDLIAQHDGVPVEWTLPTDAWPTDVIIVDHHQVDLPPAHPIDEIDEIRVGMYHIDNQQRLDVVVLEGGVSSVDSAVRLQWVIP